MDNVRNNYDVLTGLNEAEVKARYAKGLNNKPVEPPSKTVGQIIASNVFTYFNLIFFIIAGAIIAVRQYLEINFMVIIIVNTVIGIVQEIKSKRTLDKLSLLNTPTAVVVRDGREFKIDIHELVLDDLVVFATGNQIYADAVVVDGEVTVNEALITGESDEITKKAGDNLLSGSYIVTGKCYAKLTAVGCDSFVAKLTIDAKKMRKNKRAGMMKSLTRLVQVIGVVVIPLGALMIYVEKYHLKSDNATAVVNTAGALLGMIPEGLYLLTSVALAVSVMRLAKKQTLVHDLGCIESLARVDVLCVDKTGTITESKMQVSDIVSLNRHYTRYDIDTMVGDLVGNLEADNDTMRALNEYFYHDNFRQARSVVPFSSSTKYSAVTFGRGDGFVIGAPEFILRDRYRDYKKIIEEHTVGGNRVLLFASYEAPLDGGTLMSRAVSPIGLIKLINNVRENAPETFKFFTDQGVEVKVISGDNPKTASEAAKQARIPGADNYIDLSTCDDKEIAEAAEKYTVFGRVTPSQKRILVRALKKAGHTVAMTGDGVNDVLALKEADCSVAMASGSEVACQVSNLVLLNSDFSSMPAVVAEGRRVINNIERTASLFLVKNIFSIVIAIISVFAVFSYPVTPSKLSLINAVTIGIPSFFLALEPNTNPLRGKFLRNVLYRALPAALCNIFILIGVVLFRDAFKIDNDEISTISTVLIGTVGLIMLYYVCRPFNWQRRVLLIFMIALLIFGLVFTPWLFNITPISYGGALVMAVFMLLSVPAMRFFRRLIEKINNIYQRIFKHKNPKSKKSMITE